MISACGTDQRVGWQRFPSSLEVFLEPRFRILKKLSVWQLPDTIRVELKHKLLAAGKAPVQINRTDQRLHHIRQYGLSPVPPALEFPTPEFDVLSQTQAGGNLRERFPADQPGAIATQIAFRGVGKVLKK